jgi:glyoxylase-like metal-dependent hydrolase (beta-lactamase superfamily II)
VFVHENARVDEVAPGIRRLTVPLPISPGHVHLYVAEGEDGLMLVDAGLGDPGLEELLREELAGHEIARILITHFHPDHVWGGEAAVRVTGAPVAQGILDYAQCERVWGSGDWAERLARWFKEHGVPAPVADELVEQGRAAAPLIRFARDPEPLADGDRVNGWTVLELPGHADGHLGFLRDGVLLAGDHLLPDITPTVGFYPESEPDPLGSYLASLGRTVELAPRLALPAHGDPIGDPAARAAEIVLHHERRLDETAAALAPEPRTGYEVSLTLFPGELGPSQRRFAVAETLSHLERLVATGGARRGGDVGAVTYTASDPVGRRRNS